MNEGGHDKVCFKHAWKTYDMNEILRISCTKKVYATMTGSNEKRRTPLVRSEQKSISCMKDIVNISSEPGELVLYLFSGIFATAKE